MYCQKCGAEITDGAKFCRSCGAPLNAEMEQETAPKEAVKAETESKASEAERKTAEAAKAASEKASETAAAVSAQMEEVKEKVKKNLDKDATFGKFLRLYFPKPQEAINLLVKEKDTKSGIVCLVLEFLVVLVTALMLAGAIYNEIGGWFASYGDFFGPIFGLELFTAVFLVGTPFLVVFVLGKMNKTGKGVAEAFISATTVNLLLFIALLIAGMVAFASVKFGLIIFTVVLVAWFFMVPASYTEFGGNYMADAKNLWVVVGISIVMLLIFGSILYSYIENVGDGILSYIFDF